MPLKDYYLTLGVSQTASQDEVKTAYRMLALKYHPDRAADNPFAEAHFKEIAEAYAVLSNAAKRRAYDEERWLRGATSRSKTAGVHISPEWLLSEARRLLQHMQSVDTYRMNHAALRDYILLLLSDDHLSVWHREATAEQDTELVDIVLAATKGQKPVWFAPVAERLLVITGQEEVLRSKIDMELRQRRKSETQERWLPLLIILTAVLVCLAAFYLLRP